MKAQANKRTRKKNMKEAEEELKAAEYDVRTNKKGG
jgi:hypothetical protein